jgi:parallel beta helix pectate lyase-like protein
MSRIASRTLICLISLFVAASGFAQNNRSFVSTTGNDLNTCAVGNPCRTFLRAIAQTNAGGEIIALDSGGYGPFTISKSVSVVAAPGIYAALTATNGDGIDVTAGASDTVEIRGLNITILSGGATGNGINATSFGALTIENCIVKGGLVTGIWIAGNAGSHATVVDTDVRAAGSYGYQIQSRAALVRCRAEKNGQYGLILPTGSLAVADAIVSAVDFVAVGNGAGVALDSQTDGHHAILNLDHALISNNTGYGVFAFSSSAQNVATVRVTNSTVTDNSSYGFDQEGSSIFSSMNNNMVVGNALGDTRNTISLITVH